MKNQNKFLRKRRSLVFFYVMTLISVSIFSIGVYYFNISVASLGLMIFSISTYCLMDFRRQAWYTRKAIFMAGPKILRIIASICLGTVGYPNYFLVVVMFSFAFVAIGEIHISKKWRTVI